MRVLVIGGDISEKKAIETILPGSEITLSWVDSVDECVAILSNGPTADLVLLDGKLATIDSGSAFVKLCPDDTSPSVIVFSDQAADKSSEIVLRMGAADLVSTKDLSTLKLSVLRLIEKGRTANHDKVAHCSFCQFSENHFSHGICAADHQNVIMHWSPGMERMFGIKREQAIGQALGNILTFIGKDQQDIISARAGGTGQNFHEHYVRTRNKVARFHITYGPQKISGNQAGLVCLLQEVDNGANGYGSNTAGASSAAERSNAGIASLEDRTQLIADALPNLVWLSDEEGMRTLFNDKWLAFTGRAMAQETGNGWWAGVHAEDAVKLANTIAEALKVRQAYHSQYRLRRADGQYRMLLESGVPQFSHDGSFFGLMGSCNDVSETNFSQPATEPARLSANFSTTLDHAPIAIWRLDRDLVIKRVNKAAALQLRLSESDIVGMHFTELIKSIPSSIFDAVLNRGERVQLENQAIFLTEAAESGKTVFWDLVAWPQTDSEAHVVGVCLSSAEVTERHRKSQLKDDFVAALVHDLKTPLIGADRTLEQMIAGELGSLDSEQTDVLNMLRRSNHALLSMVQNLIEVYRYEGGRPRLLFEEFDLSDHLCRCISELHALAENRGVELVVALPSQHVRIVGDRLAIRRVFLNLLDNALKFTGRGGTVRLLADQEADCVKVRVSDNGIGMTLDDQRKIFHRYYQGDGGKRYAIGTGLGLYLCKQIVTAHQGAISVDSEKDIGTTFSITLPVAHS